MTIINSDQGAGNGAEMQNGDKVVMPSSQPNKPKGTMTMTVKNKLPFKTPIKLGAGSLLGELFIVDAEGNYVIKGDDLTVEICQAIVTAVNTFEPMREALKFSLSVLQANPMETSERLAIVKLESAIALTEKG